MLSSPIACAILSGLCGGVWAVCVKAGSTRISPAIGAMVVAGTALLVNATVAGGIRMRGGDLGIGWSGFLLLVVAGIAASGIDIFGLMAFERGLKLSSSLISFGVTTAVVLAIGFLVLQEPLTPLRLAGLGLIVAGVLILQAQGS